MKKIQSQSFVLHSGITIPGAGFPFGAEPPAAIVPPPDLQQLLNGHR